MIILKSQWDIARLEMISLFLCNSHMIALYFCLFRYAGMRKPELNMYYFADTADTF